MVSPSEPLNCHSLRWCGEKSKRRFPERRLGHCGGNRGWLHDFDLAGAEGVLLREGGRAPARAPRDGRSTTLKMQKIVQAFHGSSLVYEKHHN